MASTVITLSGMTPTPGDDFSVTQCIKVVSINSTLDCLPPEDIKSEPLMDEADDLQSSLAAIKTESSAAPYIEIAPSVRDGAWSNDIKTEPLTEDCDSEPWFAKVEQECLQDIKQEPDDDETFSAEYSNDVSQQAVNIPTHLQSADESPLPLSAGREKLWRKAKAAPCADIKPEVDVADRKPERETASSLPATNKRCKKRRGRKRRLTKPAVMRRGVFPCAVCGKVYAHKESLKMHHRTAHTNERPFSCSVCGKAFAQSTSLRSHERTHTGERRYKCEICGRAFQQSGHLTRHSEVHRVEKPFTCYVCGEDFGSDSQHLSCINLLCD